jgi:hypothetical protein
MGFRFLLPSPSTLDIQCVLDIFVFEGSLLGMYFNVKKSHCLVLGPRCNLVAMSINDL